MAQDTENLKETINFGEHLTIDGYEGVYEKLDSKELVEGILNDLPIKIGMRKISDPEVYGVPGNNKKDPGGWSGFVLIEESHISIHTFPKKGFLSADIYTCKNGLDVEFILNFFKDKFGSKDIEYHLIKRGTKYPVQDLY